VLLRGGLRDADVLPAEFDAVGDGVEDILISASLSSFNSDILSFEEVVDMIPLISTCPIYSSQILGIFYRRATNYLLSDRIMVERGGVWWCTQMRLGESKLGV
jgi:hypothetical protein